MALGAVLVLVAGGVGGYAAWRAADSTTTLTDTRSALSVTVPDSWDGDSATDGWQPPGSDATYPAISVGATPDWVSSGAAGAFVGILPGVRLPAHVPQHPECASAEDPIDDDRDGDRSVTVYFDDCAGMTVVERVVRVADNRLLWVQVRAVSRGTAVAVLDSVTTSGL